MPSRSTLSVSLDHPFEKVVPEPPSFLSKTVQSLEGPDRFKSSNHVVKPGETLSSLCPRCAVCSKWSLMTHLSQVVHSGGRGFGTLATQVLHMHAVIGYCRPTPTQRASRTTPTPTVTSFPTSPTVMATIARRRPNGRHTKISTLNSLMS